MSSNAENSSLGNPIDTFDIAEDDKSQLLAKINEVWRVALTSSSDVLSVLPEPESLAHARLSLFNALPERGIGLKCSSEHLLKGIVPGFYRSAASTYYGFVTGGSTPAARFADQLVTAFDQNVQVHIPTHSVSTDVEKSALYLLTDLFRLEKSIWSNGTITTGATASNILGLACGRQFVLGGCSPAEYGLVESMRASGIDNIHVLTTMPHSSVKKAAAVLGIGRSNVKDISRPGSEPNPVLFDYAALELELAKDRIASIVVVSCSEVNTGFFATKGVDDFKLLRKLCDKYHAWLHVDGAFGLFARCLPDGFEVLRSCCDGIELADSITVDAHKLLNVPYDCGAFLCRSANILESVFTNGNAPYLQASGETLGIVSPNNLGIENSRRFRALPVYTTLITYGRRAYAEMLASQVRLARSIALWLQDHPLYEVLPLCASKEELRKRTFVIVLFRALDDRINSKLSCLINGSMELYVTDTNWMGVPASRIAVSNWRVNTARDFEIVKKVLNSAVRNKAHS